MKQRRKAEDECDERIRALEELNKRLHESVVDLKARSMRDNLLFHNIEEVEREDCTEVIYELLQEKLENQMQRAQSKSNVHTELAGNAAIGVSLGQL